MKKLFLVRHAKSDWGNPLLKDEDRPLNQRGYTDALLMGEVLKKKNVFVDAIISSTAIRAVSTAIIIGRSVHFPLGNIKLVPSLYMANSDTLLDIIKKTSNKTDHLMLFSHNPTMSNALNLFCKNTEEAFPTCGIAVIQFHSHEWKKISSENSELEFFIYPKMFKESEQKEE